MVDQNWHYPRTALADQIIKTFDAGQESAFLIFARRRMGKTTFLVNDIAPRAHRKKWRCVYVDFWEGQSSPTVRLAHEIDQHLDYEPGDFLPGKLKKLKVTSIFETEHYETKSRKSISSDPLLALDDMIEKLADQNKKTVFLFDEFQETAKHPEGRKFLRQIRGSLNKRKERICTIFTGSSIEGLKAIFEDRKGPFFDFATQIPFRPLGDGFVDHCLVAFKKSTGRELNREESLQAFKTLDRVTRNFREYLNRLNFDPDLSPKDALEQAREKFAEDYSFGDIWASLQPRDRALLVIMASGESRLFSKRVAQSISELAELDKAPTRSAVQSALKRLSTGKLVDNIDQEGWTFMDPEFKRWVRNRFPQQREQS